MRIHVLAICASAHLLWTGVPGTASTAPVTECDRLAAHAEDHQRASRVPGRIDLPVAELAAAEKACREAVAAYPDAGRFKYQLGRVLLAKPQPGPAKGCRDALEILEAGYAQGHAWAATAIAGCIGTSFGASYDGRAALPWHRKAAAMGSSRSQTAIAIQIGYGGFGYRKDTRLALRELHRLAALRDTSALFFLSDQYRHGFWVRKDQKRSFAYLLAAAERGDLRSLHLAAQLYSKGTKGAPLDRDKAREMLERAAELGSTRAAGRMTKLGLDKPPQPRGLLPHGKRLD